MESSAIVPVPPPEEKVPVETVQLSTSYPVSGSAVKETLDPDATLMVFGIAVNSLPDVTLIFPPIPPSTLYVTGYMVLFHCAVYVSFVAGNVGAEGNAGFQALKVSPSFTGVGAVSGAPYLPDTVLYPVFPSIVPPFGLNVTVTVLRV